ncbi:hypothetical protein AB0H83_25350 [Dactylosporangium sp. NPDC050688]|uniref:hypothetical protein n=1 Tax=Dactylosporangium sp. NPDC050688 TaxID=3157217 RepID=UPI0033E1CFF2
MHRDAQPAAPTETQQLTFVPDYGLITVADVGHGGVDSDLVAAAYSTVSAASATAVVIKVAQDQLPVDVFAEVWSDAPQIPHDQGWSAPVEYRIECPSGDIRVGAPAGDAIGVSFAAGPHVVRLAHRGRAEAGDLTAVLRRETAGTDPVTRRAELDRRGGGVEQYLLQFWPAS